MKHRVYIAAGHVNKVNKRWAWLVLGWATVSRHVIQLGM